MRSLRIFQSALILTMTMSIYWPAAAAARLSQSEITTIKAAVKACVTQANTPYASFDAYYNAGSGMVERNAGTVFTEVYEAQNWQRASFAFDKCMSEQGVPLMTPK
jgi:hypothetical protein